MLVSAILSIVLCFVEGSSTIELSTLLGIVVGVALIIIYCNARNGQLSIGGIKTIKVVYQIRMWITIIAGAIMLVVLLVVAIMPSIIMERLNENADEIALQFKDALGLSVDDAVEIRDFLQSDEYASIIVFIAIGCMVIFGIAMIFAILFLRSVIKLLRTVMENAEGNYITCKTGFISFILIAGAIVSGLSVLATIGDKDEPVIEVIITFIEAFMYIIGYMLIVEYKKIDFSDASNDLDASNVSEAGSASERGNVLE